MYQINGAGEESRTLDLNLGKVALYQLSYSRIHSLIVYTGISVFLMPIEEIRQPCPPACLPGHCAGSLGAGMLFRPWAGSCETAVLAQC